jgi:RNA methyltransferase, TrmH family
VDAAGPLQSLTLNQRGLIRALLQDKQTRVDEGAFIIEGAKSCLDIIRRHPQAIRSLILSSHYLQTESDSARQVRSNLAVPQYHCTDPVFEQFSDVETPQGVLAVVRTPRWDESQIFRQARVLGIYGDQLRDPANVGAIIRTAAALNLTGVWLSADSADHFSPKVVRAAAGVMLTLPVFRTEDIQRFSQQHCSIYAALVPSPDTISLRSIQKIPARVMIAVGNEGRGLAPDLVKASQVKFSIPLARDVDSLNVAATAAIASFHFSGLPIEF